MQQHLLQADHNQEFHDSLCEKFKDKFYDWKITCLFYVAIHYIKALAAQRGIYIGDTHYEIENNINPDRNNCKMRITRNAWEHYRSLLKYSKTARYDGIHDPELFEQLRSTDHSMCKAHLDFIEKYVSGQGIELTKKTA